MIKTYKDYIDAGGNPLYVTKFTGRADGLFMVRCSCGHFTFPQTLVDVSDFDVTLTNGQEFACDGCISTWERECRPLKDGDDFLVPEEHRAAFSSHRLGVRDNLAWAAAVNRLDRSVSLAQKAEDRRAKSLGVAANDDPEMQRLKGITQKIRNRIISHRL